MKWNSYYVFLSSWRANIFVVIHFIYLVIIIVVLWKIILDENALNGWVYTENRNPWFGTRGGTKPNYVWPHGKRFIGFVSAMIPPRQIGLINGCTLFDLSCIRFVAMTKLYHVQPCLYIYIYILWKSTKKKKKKSPYHLCLLIHKSHFGNR